MILIAAVGQVQAASAITVEVGNVRNDSGRVIIDICPQDRFLGDGCPYHGEAEAHSGTTVVVVDNMPAGQFAVQAFHDENANGEIDRGLFGIPKEGVGFSRDARIGLGPPKWRDAVFNHEARPQTIRLNLRYFMGARGPVHRN
jgi:uncharacterized protein (DUF2141 family)